MGCAEDRTELVTRTTEDILGAGSARLGVKLSPVQTNTFLIYIKELMRWNAVVNLTGATTAREIVLKHVLDSLTGLLLLPTSVHRLVDIGTGAGFPGLPLKIARPDLEVTLVESVHKKAAFLISACARLELQGVTVLCERAEQVEGLFDAAVARAVGPPAHVASLALSLVKPGGHLLLYLGPRTARLVSDRPLPRWRWTETVAVTLPFEAGERAVSLWERRP